MSHFILQLEELISQAQSRGQLDLLVLETMYLELLDHPLPQAESLCRCVELLGAYAESPEPELLISSRRALERVA